MVVVQAPFTHFWTEATRVRRLPVVYACPLHHCRQIRCYQRSRRNNWELMLPTFLSHAGTPQMNISHARGPFLASLKTFRAHFGWHNSPCIFKTKAPRSKKLCSYFRFYSLYNIRKDQFYRISGSGYYEKLLGTFEKRVPGQLSPRFSNYQSRPVKRNLTI